MAPGFLTAQKLVAAMPGEILRCRPVRGVGGERELAILHPREQVSGIASLGEVPFGDQDGVVIPERPEAVVEEPVGVLGKGDAVVQGVVAAAGELVDVGRVDDGAAGEGDQAVAGQGAGVVVGGDDTDAKPPFPAALHRFPVGGGLGAAAGVGGRGRFFQQRPEGGLFVRFEIASDEDQAGLRPESGVVDCAEKFSVEADAGRQVAVAQDLPLLIEGLPEAVRAHVEQGQLQVGFLRPAVDDDGPEAGEAEGEFAGDRQELIGEDTFFGEFEKTEQEQGFVRRGAPGAVDFQVGEFVEEAWHGALIQ